MKLYDKILLLTTLQIVAIFIFGIYQIQSLYLTQKKAFDQKNLIQIEMIQKRFEEKLIELQKTAHILINSQEVITGILSNDTDMLYNWSKLFLSSSIDKIHFIDLDGTVISRGEAEFRFADDISKQFYTQQALLNNTFLGIDRVDGEECLVYTERVKQYGEKPIGIISVALVIDHEFLSSLVEGTTMSLAYQSEHQSISTAKERTLINASSLSLMLQSGSINDATFSIGLTSEKELLALKEARTNFFLGIALALIVLVIALHFTLLKYLKEYETLAQVLIDFYEDRLDIKDVIGKIKLSIHKQPTTEIKKIAEALFNMSQKVSDTQNALELLSSTDQLTALANRRKLEEYLEQKLKESNRGNFFSIVMLDIDRFKVINDTYGHEIGDHVLIHTANLMQSVIRESDMLGRWGGEEFLLILPQTNLEGALVMAEQLRSKIYHYQFEHYPQRVTMCLGVAEYRVNDTPNSILRRADHALYRAKNNGRNKVEYEN
ncbi:sensor domain-containing diguanylate cyclase [Sulfurospirillum arsenophilum]|uniref:sensor domain-containing diguanylate cyclase n=1 Tax=Sulfurospirillum arsenophilum TaxID=56698 RepID=UPI000693FD85|nr:diguanylate cyclase [Sulfurospirillum arsenophilum]